MAAVVTWAVAESDTTWRRSRLTRQRRRIGRVRSNRPQPSRLPDQKESMMSIDESGQTPCWQGVDAVGESLVEQAAVRLQRIDDDREAARLLAEGVDVATVAERTGLGADRVEGLLRQVREGAEIRPVTPAELGYRRAVGQISTDEMMQRLRAWPYTFGRLMIDAWDAGSWDDIRSLHMGRYLTDGEYRELQAATAHLPRREDVTGSSPQPGL
ncbi:MAG: hypothetical protein Q4G45_12980 [Actinomycetia bacterium]|nr:hypothetical protein [Actinomycetes bacterium]